MEPVEAEKDCTIAVLDGDSLSEAVESHASVPDAGIFENEGCANEFCAPNTSFQEKITAPCLQTVVLCLAFQLLFFLNTNNNTRIPGLDMLVVSNISVQTSVTWTSPAHEGKVFEDENMTWDVEGVARERATAQDLYVNGGGFLWFYHLQKAGGTSLCHYLQKCEESRSGVSGFRVRRQACYLEGLSKEGCYHDLWMYGYSPNLDCSSVLTQERLWVPTCGLNSSDDSTRIDRHLAVIEKKIKDVHPENRLVSSETVFLPRAVIKAWLIDRDIKLVKRFSRWTFLISIRHPVERLYSAFRFHKSWFEPCVGNFSFCLTTPLFTQGPHRNKLVKELSGWYLPCERGDYFYPNFSKDGKFVSQRCENQQVEADRFDLMVAKLVLQRFLPPVVIDRSAEGNSPSTNSSDCAENIVKNDLCQGKMSEIPFENRRHEDSCLRSSCISENDYERAALLNELDMELYEYAMELRCEKGS